MNYVESENPLIYFLCFRPPRKRGRPKNSTNVDEKVARTDDESKKKGAPDNSSTNKPVRKSANATTPRYNTFEIHLN